MEGYLRVDDLCPELGDEVDLYLPMYGRSIKAKVTLSPKNPESGMYFWNFINPIDGSEMWRVLQANHLWKKEGEEWKNLNKDYF